MCVIVAKYVAQELVRDVHVELDVGCNVRHLLTSIG